ncbi:hypothetical protein GCM10027424_12280 [Psychrobacter pacificensis]|uniref:Uncharacterized protein n=1 Tax=Psychrobacter pacificensis TaxID=112002 RepID=A0ABQ5YYP6_9GAMM|nr:hypothetical protein GCM10007915_05240 [Psychrobacter pacificensis]
MQKNDIGFDPHDEFFVINHMYQSTMSDYLDKFCAKRMNYSNVTPYELPHLSG